MATETKKSINPLFAVFPHLEKEDGINHVALGDFPTPIDKFNHPETNAQIFLKREDKSSKEYGGVKVRTLEFILGAARAKGATRVWTLGGYGSNHSVATSTFVGRAGLKAGAFINPQHHARDNALNCAATYGFEDVMVWPLAMARRWMILPWNICMLLYLLFLTTLWRLGLYSERNYFMRPGGFGIMGALGHAGAALEVAKQIEEGACPPPKHLVLVIGSGTTTTGLVVGIALARRLGMGFGGVVPGGTKGELPRITGVRIQGGEVPSANGMYRSLISFCVKYTCRYLAERGCPNVEEDALAIAEGLEITGEFAGHGYGYISPAGDEARVWMEKGTITPMPEPRSPAAIAAAEQEGESKAGDGEASAAQGNYIPSTAAEHPLDLYVDSSYQAKSASALRSFIKTSDGPFLYWCTKNNNPLPPPSPVRRSNPPGWLKQWLEKAHATLSYADTELGQKEAAATPVSNASKED